jgi:hypothetical protein
MNSHDHTVTILDRRETLNALDETQSDVKTLGFGNTSAEIWLKRSLFFSTPWLNKYIKHSDSTSNTKTPRQFAFAASTRDEKKPATDRNANERQSPAV